jgi:hypothetical protein
MRNTLAVSLTLLASAAAIGADKPIPQDTARMEARYRERLEWNRQTLERAYDKVGRKDPRWDESARHALDLAARMFAQQKDPVITIDDIHPSAKKALDAGCDDPLILYLYARTSAGLINPTPAEYAQRLNAVADAMAASGYSPLRRAVVLRYASDVTTKNRAVTPQERRDVERRLDAILDLLPESVAEDQRNYDWEDGWYDILHGVVGMHRRLVGDLKAAFDPVDAKLAKISGIEALRLAVKGSFLINWGWLARTNALAPDVSEEQFHTFETRLTDARTALNAAWAANPGEPNVATRMLEVEKGIGGGNREAMEIWFDRAMKTNGNDYDACWTKLDWLDPKWYGDKSGADMLAFGKACRATKNWWARLTLLAAEAHWRHATFFGPQERIAYLRKPEVWSEITDVYDEYLKHCGFDNVRRSKYAAICYFGAHYREAHAQFQALGDLLTTWPDSPNVSLEALKKLRDETAQIVSGKSSGLRPPGR